MCVSKLIQIAASEAGLFALDVDGGVWAYVKEKGWYPLVADQLVKSVREPEREPTPVRPPR